MNQKKMSKKEEKKQNKNYEGKAKMIKAFLSKVSVTNVLKKIMEHKNQNMLGNLVFENNTFKEDFIHKLENMGSSVNVKGIYAFDEAMKTHPCIDG